MRDIEQLLGRAAAAEVPAPDLDALHRRGMRRRWTVRAGSASAVVAVVAVGATLALSGLASPTVDVEPLAPAGGDDGSAPAEASDGELAVQACMEDAGLRYDVEPGTGPPPSAFAVTPSFLTERHDPSVARSLHEDRVAAVEERGWLGYRQWLDQAPVAPGVGERPGATQSHLSAPPHDGVEDPDASLDDYRQQLTECQEEAYDIEMFGPAQVDLLEEVRGADWSAAKTTGELSQDERVQDARRQREECLERLRAEHGLDEDVLAKRLDEIAEAAGHEPPEMVLDSDLDPPPEPASGWSFPVLLDADVDEVAGLREFVDDTRQATLERVECHWQYTRTVNEVAEELAPEYLASRAQELRAAGIEVDLDGGRR